MESDVVSIELPNGEILQLKTDGSDFKKFSTEKKGMICAYLKGLLKTKESFIAYGVSQDEYLCDLFVQLVKQLRFERYGIAKSNYEHVEHPAHYNHYGVETIDMMVSIWGKEKVADWCEMTAFKYRMRMGMKPDNSVQQDLDKEKWYLNKAKELRNECVE